MSCPCSWLGVRSQRWNTAGGHHVANSDAKYCYTHDNTWTLTKEVTGNTVDNGVGTVTWTVTATKDSSGAPTFTVHGGLTITNIVVNLQKPNSPKMASNAPYVSIAADVADATMGDAATMANMNGKTINNILTDANNALGGNGLASYYGGSFNNLNDLVNELNGSFHSCAIGTLATTYLCPICP